MSVRTSQYKTSRQSRPARAELFHTDGQPNWKEEKTVPFSNFAKNP